MSGEAWAFVFLFVILKIPVCAALYLVWWSSRSVAPADGTPVRADPGHRGPRPPRRWPPRPPRRGPHAGPLPVSPARVRAHVARPVRTHR